MGKNIWIICLCVVLLAACGKSTTTVDMSKVETTTLGVNGDGTLDEVIIEEFEMDYYSVTDLESFVKEQVDAFNIANASLWDSSESEGVTVVSIENDSEAQTARLELSYLNDAVYAAFNDIVFEQCTVGDLSNSDAAWAMSLVNGEVLTSAEKDTLVTYDDFKSSSKFHVVYVERSVRIQTSGKIAYYSLSCTLVEDTTILTGDGESIVIFK